MNVYIREKKEKEILVHKWLNKIIERFCILQVKKEEEGILIIVPNLEHKKVINKIMNKIKKIEKPTVILSKKVKTLQKEWKELKIMTGKKLQKYFLPHILEKIKQNNDTQDLYLLLDSYHTENIQIVEYFLEKWRSINIITKEVKKYSQLEEKIFEDKGIIITVSNNKKKGLKKARLIVNVDFFAQRLKEFKIDRKAIIINCVSQKIEDIMGFEGIIINKIEIGPRVETLWEEFEEIEIYESKYEYKNTFESNVKQIEASKRCIEYFIGNNGKIEETEILNITKIA